MSRVYSKIPSVHLALGTKSVLPAILACRPQLLFSKSPVQRSAFFLQRQLVQFKAFSTDNGYERDNNSPHTPSNPHLPPSSTLYIGNVPFEATADDIKQSFEAFGGLKKIIFGIHPDGRSKGYAHIEFETLEEANAVLDAHQRAPFAIGERTVVVAYGVRARDARPMGLKQLDPSTCLYVGNLPYDATDEDVKQALGDVGDINSITTVRLAYDYQGLSKGFAHVDFTSIDDAERVYQHYVNSPISILGREVRVDRAVPPTTEHPPSPRLYFRGFSGTQDQLQEVLDGYGYKALDILLLKNIGSGIPTGAGFMQFESKEIASDVANALRGQVLMGNVKFEVAYARPRTGPRTRNDGRNDGRNSRTSSSSYGSGYGSGYGNRQSRSSNWGR